MGKYPDNCGVQPLNSSLVWGNRDHQQHGLLSKINELVRFARKRFGSYELIDFPTVCATSLTEQEMKP